MPLRLGVCIVLLLSGVACRQADSGPDQTDAAASPGPTGDLEAWAGGLCGALNRWEEAAVRLGGEAQQAIAQKPTPTEGKQILRDLLDPLLVETRLLIGDVEGLGPPPVDPGAEIGRRLGDGLNHTLGILLKARATAEALPQNRKAFLVGTQEVNRLIQGSVTRIETTIKDIDESFDEPELAAAFDNSRECGPSRT